VIFNLRRRETFPVLPVEAIEREKSGGKPIVLLLENEYFELVKVSVDRDLDPDERELFVENEIRAAVLDYDPAEYIRNESILDETPLREELLVLMLKTEKAVELIAGAKEAGVTVAGILPFFLYALLSENEENPWIFADIGLTRTVLATMAAGKLADIDCFYIEKSEIRKNSPELTAFADRVETAARLSLPEADANLGELLKAALPELSIDSRPMTAPLRVERKTLDRWNFIPAPYRAQLTGKARRRTILAWGAALILLELGLSFPLNFWSSRLRKEYEAVEAEFRTLSEQAAEKRQALEDFADYGEALAKLRQRDARQQIRFTDILANLRRENTKNITISFIEYGEAGKVQIRGAAADDGSIYAYEENISDNETFASIRQDYIREKDGIYEFQMDLRTGGRDE
jgi:hypothetical protein